MANPLKVLTQLSASKEAQFAEVVEMQKTVTVSGGDLKYTNAEGEISGSGAFKNAGAAQLGSSLDVKGAAALSSSLGVVGAADLQSTLAVAGIASFASDMSGAAGFDLVGAAHIGGAVDMDSTLNVDGAASFQSNVSGAANLDIGGQAHIAGAAQLDSTLDAEGAVNFASTLDVVGDIATQASASIAGDLDVDGAADIAGNLDVHGDAVIYGNLEVKGTMTTIESTTVTVADANIQLATVASPTDATADGAGITILGATNKTFQWNDDGHGFTSSEDMNLAAGKVYKIDGQEVLAKDASEAKLSFNDGTANVRVQDNWVKIAGPLNLEGAVEAESTMLVTGVATFSSDITASAGLDLAGNAHIAGQLDVDQAADLGSTLAVAGVATFSSDITASAGLDVAAAAHFAAAVDMDAALNVDGVATFASDITASANLDVAGDVHVAGGKLEIDRVGDFAMVELDGFAAIYANSGNEIAIADGALSLNRTTGVAYFSADVTASVGLDVAGNAHIAGQLDVDQAADLGSTLAVAGVASFAADITGSAHLFIDGNARIDGMFEVGEESTFESAATFQSNIWADAALNLSGSAFINITTPVVSGKYNVNDAIRALDDKAGQQASNINSNYAALRYLDSDFFDANGMAAFTSSFAAADIEQVSVDVLVQAGGSGPWTNDLLSVQVKAAGSYVGFEISAPAMAASDKVRIIAVKESGSLA